MDEPYVLQIAICEDEPADAALLESYIEKSGDRADMRRGCFAKYRTALDKWRLARAERD